LHARKITQSDRCLPRRRRKRSLCNFLTFIKSAVQTAESEHGGPVHWGKAAWNADVKAMRSRVPEARFHDT
ncbi:MAG: hypothetical protein ACXW2A_07700, partial [Burkholderiales bacterium]